MHPFRTKRFADWLDLLFQRFIPRLVVWLVTDPFPFPFFAVGNIKTLFGDIYTYLYCFHRMARFLFLVSIHLGGTQLPSIRAPTLIILFVIPRPAFMLAFDLSKPELAFSCGYGLFLSPCNLF